MQHAWLLQSPRLETAGRSERTTTPGQGPLLGPFSGQLARAPAPGNTPRLQVFLGSCTCQVFSTTETALHLHAPSRRFPSQPLLGCRHSKNLKGQTLPTYGIRRFALHLMSSAHELAPFYQGAEQSRVSKWRGPETHKTHMENKNTRAKQRPSQQASPQASLRQHLAAPADARGRFSNLVEEWDAMFQMTRLLNWA
jgi:hypothetical protein